MSRNRSPTVYSKRRFLLFPTWGQRWPKPVEREVLRPIAFTRVGTPDLVEQWQTLTADNVREDAGAAGRRVARSDRPPSFRRWRFAAGAFQFQWSIILFDRDAEP